MFERNHLSIKFCIVIFFTISVISPMWLGDAKGVSETQRRYVLKSCKFILPGKPYVYWFCNALVQVLQCACSYWQYWWETIHFMMYTSNTNTRICSSPLISVLGLNSVSNMAYFLYSWQKKLNVFCTTDFCTR